LNISRFTDDQRLDTIGCLNRDIVKTPNIDRLAHLGVPEGGDDRWNRIKMITG